MKPLCWITRHRGNSAMPTALKFGVQFHVLQRPLCHLFLSLVSQQRRSIFQPDPTSLRNFNSHSRCNIVNAPGAVAHEVETHDLENPRSVAPRARIYILSPSLATRSAVTPVSS